MSASGTPEKAWKSWPALQGLPSLPRPTGRIVVVSAHPDDEVLGAGGLIASLADSPASLSFVTATDGEASHAGSSSVRPDDLARLRAAELRAGLAKLGQPAARVIRLRLPDSAVAEHVDELAAGLERGIGSADLVICPAVADGHIDHTTVGRLTQAVCSGRVPVWEVPIWIWHWTLPGDGAIPWERAQRYELTSAEMQAKRAAVECFATQVRPFPEDASGTTILPPEMLEHFARPFEVFFT